VNRLILHRSTVVVIKLERCRGLMPVTGRSIETTVITGRLGQNHTIAGDTKLLRGWWPVVTENPASKNDLGLLSFIVLTMMMKSSYGWTRAIMQRK